MKGSPLGDQVVCRVIRDIRNANHQRLLKAHLESPFYLLDLRLHDRFVVAEFCLADKAAELSGEIERRDLVKGVSRSTAVGVAEDWSLPQLCED